MILIPSQIRIAPIPAMTATALKRRAVSPDGICVAARANERISITPSSIDAPPRTTTSTMLR